jgi:hypothetical protein
MNKNLLNTEECVRVPKNQNPILTTSLKNNIQLLLLLLLLLLLDNGNPS